MFCFLPGIVFFIDSCVSVISQQDLVLRDTNLTPPQAQTAMKRNFYCDILVTGRGHAKGHN